MGVTPYRDPDDQRRYAREHYAANRQKYLDKSKARNARVRGEKRAAMLDAKRQPCADCGVQYPPHSMEFHHVRGEKVTNVATMAGSNTWSVADLMQEIGKCVVLCTPCHRERHWPTTD